VWVERWGRQVCEVGGGRVVVGTKGYIQYLSECVETVGVPRSSGRGRGRCSWGGSGETCGGEARRGSVDFVLVIIHLRLVVLLLLVVGRV